MKKTLPIFFAFLCMGFGDVAGTLVGIAKAEYNLSDFQSNLVLFAGFLGFGLLSIPMGLFQDRRGKKTTLLIGLAVAIIGVAIPYFLTLSSFGILLIAVLILGLGAAILQVAGNPIMRDVSEPGKYSSNLSLGQFVKAIGSIAGPLIPVFAYYSTDIDWKILFPIFLMMMVVSFVLIATLRIEESKSEKTASLGSCFRLLKEKFVLIMVLGIFLYVGAEASVNGNIAIYMQKLFGWQSEKAPLMIANFFAALTIGRLIGSQILKVLSPVKFLKITVTISILGLISLAAQHEIATWVSVFVIGFGFANVFPLIFSITVDKMPERTNELSGLMVTAIVGGAIVPPIMGFVADKTSVVPGFLVPLAAIVYIGWTALYASGRQTNQAE